LLHKYDISILYEGMITRTERGEEGVVAHGVVEVLLVLNPEEEALLDEVNRPARELCNVSLKTDLLVISWGGERTALRNA
jgi:hypothetical protein